MIFTQKKFILVIGLGAAISLAQPVRADETQAKPQKVAELNMSLSEKQQTGSSITNISVPEDEKKLGLEIATGIEYSQKNAVDERASRESDLSLTLNPSYKFNKTYSVGVKTIITKDNAGAKETKASDTKIALGIKGFDLTDQLQTTHGLVGVLPTSIASQQRDRLKGAVGLNSGLVLEATYIKLNYKLSLTRNFHEFNINADGDTNIEYSLAHSLEVTLPITEKLYLTSIGVYRTGRTYGGFEKTNFELHNDINYDLTKKLTLNLGTSNDGDALKANGVDSNISAYNDNTSVTRAGISYVY